MVTPDSQHKEVVYLVFQMQVADESAHQAGLTDTGSQGKAEGHEVTLEVHDLRKLALQQLESGLRVSLLGRRHQFGYAGQFLQGNPLGFAQGKTTGYGVYKAISHGRTPVSCSERHSCVAAFHYCPVPLVWMIGHIRVDEFKPFFCHQYFYKITYRVLSSVEHPS